MKMPQKIALICINETGERTAQYIRQKDANIRIFRKKETESLSELTGFLFQQYNGIIFCCAAGIVVRCIAPFIRSKYTDPAIVVVDNGCRSVISLLSGHEGGANNLAYYVAGLISAEPVITTATEAGKHFVIGIGAVAGIKKDTVVTSITGILASAKIPHDHIRIAATIPKKYNEPGIREGMEALSINLLRIEEERIAAFAPAFTKTAAARHLNIPAVAEPCALLAARDGILVLPVQKVDGLTLAVARERIGPK